MLWCMQGVGKPDEHFILPPVYIGALDAYMFLRDTKAFEEETHKILARTVSGDWAGRGSGLHACNSGTALSPCLGARLAGLRGAWHIQATHCTRATVAARLAGTFAAGAIAHRTAWQLCV